MAEWDRCRWVWNECVAKSKQTHLWNKNRPEGADKKTCGPAQLDKMLTEARKTTPWLREGSSVPQQQIIRDFGKSKTEAQKDIKDRLPMARRAGMPKWKKKRDALPSLNYTRRGFQLKDGELHLAGGVALTVVWSRELPADPSSMDCAHCGARAKHALPLGMRTYTCTACGTVSPRDKNSARVMLVRAGLNPAGAEGVRPPRALPQMAA